MKNHFPSPVVALLGLWAALVTSGCDSGEIKTVRVECNGYQCTACKTKFYTDGQVFADFCPQCKEMSIRQMAGYTCPASHVTVEARGRGGIKCGTCGATTTGEKLPGESDYQTWGAAKKEKSAVCNWRTGMPEARI
jgi:hypothetical protein